MRAFRATTRSGAIYDLRHGRVLITGSSRLGNTSFTVGEMYSSAEPSGFPWTEGDQSWRAVELPVVGERLAVVGLNEWRISSEIVLVKELDVVALDAAAARLGDLWPNERYRLIEESLEQFVLSESGADPIETVQMQEVDPNGL